MTYRITGLHPSIVLPYRGLDDLALRTFGACRIIADNTPGYPCRITLEDAQPGEPLILFHHLSHDVSTPFRNSFAIFAREHADRAAEWHDAIPPVMQIRTLGLKGYDAQGMMIDARLSSAGEADSSIRVLFANPAIAYIHAHNAAPGCFAAAILRDEPAIRPISSPSS
ncbi:DUF1203 domain-containing protein [Sphingobium algorifonticola]|uniref:DUF1203 domain-containing protein n=1 Tax=Sphingobium algorifonticola TaxID=2008318 RepID=A0A437JBL1_9SPHN|nr:DUF1203 domain-containing protein [Sphingobium algorifonticola]RVT43254.1 DUF1203 domain-containing protein [Sphingobium algorifonticola]